MRKEPTQSGGKLRAIRERVEGGPGLDQAPDRSPDQAEKESAEQALLTQRLQAQYGHEQVNDALTGQDPGPMGTLILAEWALGTAGLPGLMDGPAAVPGQVFSTLQSEAWAETSTAILSRHETSTAPGHAHLAAELIRRSRGTRLPAEVAARLSAALGTDISDAVIHTDSAAAEAAQAVNAHAFATGRDVFFAAGEYKPGTREGDELLAHELTHVVQDAEGRIPQASGEGLTVSSPSDSHEREAEAAGREAMDVLHGAGDVELTGMEGPAGGETEALVTTGPASLLSRDEDEAVTYGAEGTPSREERNAVKSSMSADLYGYVTELESLLSQLVIPSVSHVSPVVAEAAMLAEQYLAIVFEMVDERLIEIENGATDSSAVEGGETGSDGPEAADGDSGLDTEQSLQDLYEEDNLDLEMDIDCAFASVDRLNCFIELFGLAVFEGVAGAATLMARLSAASIWHGHAMHAARVDQKVNEAREAMERFKQEVFFDVVEKELKSAAKDVTISVLLGLVFPPAAAAPWVVKATRFVAKEVISSLTDTVEYSKKPPEFDQKFFNGQVHSWSNKALTLKQFQMGILDDDSFVEAIKDGPWGKIRVLNKTLGGMIKILEINEIAQAQLAIIHQKISAADAAVHALDENWKKVQLELTQLTGIVTRFELAAPKIKDRAAELYEDIAIYEEIMAT